jgi:hypothetical protein
LEDGTISDGCVRWAGLEIPVGFTLHSQEVVTEIAKMNAYYLADPLKVVEMVLTQDTFKLTVSGWYETDCLVKTP